MIARQAARSLYLKQSGGGCCSPDVACGAPSATAQIVETLIQFTNVWRYDQSGLELGTAWRTNDFDDAAWPSGRGLLGAESNPQSYLAHAPIHTPLTTSSTVTTFYFRTTFEFTGSLAGLSLIASNLVDDSFVIYLNGLPAGGVCAPSAYNATTLFPGPGTEGRLDPVTLTLRGNLLQGDNLLAVEVHQNSPASDDLVWGMRLMAIRQVPLAIASQPQDQTVLVGDPLLLSVGVTGGPAFYRWQKDGALIPNATNSSYSVSDAAMSASGRHQVVIANTTSAVTSRVATVTVLVNNPRPGTNVFAAALVKPLAATEFDSAFALAATGQGFRAPPLPDQPLPAPTLDIAPLDTHSVRLPMNLGSWALGAIKVRGAFSWTFESVHQQLFRTHPLLPAEELTHPQRLPHPLACQKRAAAAQCPLK